MSFNFAAELSQQVALVLPPLLEDGNSRLHNCNVSLVAENEPEVEGCSKSRAPPAEPPVVSQVLIISLVVLLLRLKLYL